METWLRYRRERPEVQARLFCFHHAGGSASAYRAWPDAMPAEIEVCPVQLPGRENRLSEPPLTDLAGMAAALADALAPLCGLPFAFFGHSMGARLAYALAAELKRRGGPMPRQLIVSASRAPHFPSSVPDMGPLDDAALKARLSRLGGLPQEVLRSAEMTDLMLRTARADFTALETYKPQQVERLACPILSLGGDQDEMAPEAALLSWADLTTAEFRMRRYSGGHFYLKDHFKPVVAETAMTVLRDIEDVWSWG